MTKQNEGMAGIAENMKEILAKLPPEPGCGTGGRKVKVGDTIIISRWEAFGPSSER